MKIGTTLYVKNRTLWRAWLRTNHSSKKEIWLVYYKKESGKQRIPYNDAVEEALCFGWIDSITKTLDTKRYVQRFSPRKPGSNLSPMNRERIRRLTRQNKMTRAGYDAIIHAMKRKETASPISVPPDILRHLKRNKLAWKNFQKFPASYKRIRIGWIDGSRNRKEFFNRRLQYFIRMTAKNRRFGMVQ